MNYSPDLDERAVNKWIMKPPVEEGVIASTDVAAKMEFLGIREDSALKTVFFFWSKV